jgi:hypothetical protein
MAATIEQAAMERAGETIDAGLNGLGFYFERVEVVFDHEASEG